MRSQPDLKSRATRWADWATLVPLFSALLRYNSHITLCKFKVYSMIFDIHIILQYDDCICVDMHVLKAEKPVGIIIFYIYCSFYLECSFIFCLFGKNLNCPQDSIPYHFMGSLCDFGEELGTHLCIPCIYLWSFMRLYCNHLFSCPPLTSDTCLENVNRTIIIVSSELTVFQNKIAFFPPSASLDSCVTLGTFCNFPASVLMNNL